MTVSLVVFDDNPEDPRDYEIERFVTLTNREWAIVSQSLEAFSETFRAKHSQIVATYVTRGQLSEATTEASRMNALLQHLDKIHSKIL